MPSPVARALSDFERNARGALVMTDPEVCERYAGDESEAMPRTPAAVVRARSEDDVVALMSACFRHEVPVTPRAGGTGRTGGAVPVEGGIVLAFEGMDALEEVHRGDLVAVVRPGLVLGQLHAAVEAEGLFYGPDPNSLASCALGGNLAENAGGPRALKYGSTRDWTLGLDVVTADGTPLRLGKRTGKGVTGYDLASLIVGSEGTLAVITRATLKLLPKPESVATLLALLPDAAASERAIAALVTQHIAPRCLELLDRDTLTLVRPSLHFSLPEGSQAALLMEVDGDEAACARALERAGNAMIDAGALEVLVAKHGGDRDKLWAARRALSPAMRASAPHKLAEDVVVPRSRIGALLVARDRIAERHEIRMPIYGHAGDGNLHVNFLWSHPDDAPRAHAAIEAVFREVVDLGGTLTGEHGVGLLKMPYLPIEQSPALIDWQRRVKATFDPRGILNPGKIFAPAASHRAC